jgi:hypothetical protein
MSPVQQQECSQTRLSGWTDLSEFVSVRFAGFRQYKHLPEEFKNRCDKAKPGISISQPYEGGFQ